MSTQMIFCIEIALIVGAVFSFMVYRHRSMQKKSLTVIGAVFDMLVLSAVFFPMLSYTWYAFSTGSLSHTTGIILLTCISIIAAACVFRDILYLVKAYRNNKRNRQMREAKKK